MEPRRKWLPKTNLPPCHQSSATQAPWRQQGPARSNLSGLLEKYGWSHVFLLVSKLQCGDTSARPSTLSKLWSDDSRHLRPAHFQITYVHALRCIRYRDPQAFCSAHLMQHIVHVSIEIRPVQPFLSCCISAPILFAGINTACCILEALHLLHGEQLQLALVVSLPFLQSALPVLANSPLMP